MTNKLLSNNFASIFGEVQQAYDR